MMGGVAALQAEARRHHGSPGSSKNMPRVEGMGQSPEWYDRDYGIGLRIVPERAWTIPR